LLDAAVQRTGKEKEAIAAEIIAELPMRRFQRPEELGVLVAFLASDQASGITGTAIPVDGGAIKGLFG
jgi:3-oxoacyl-[acyl-carrier protein] reductase